MKRGVLAGNTIQALSFLLLIGAALAAPGGAAAQEHTEAVTLALVGGRLIDGYGGPPLENSVVLVSGDRISAIGTQGVLSIPPGVEVIDTNGMSVLPGLWESHGHLFHVGEADPGSIQSRFPDEILPIMEAVARTTVKAGVTSMRDFCTACSARGGDGWRSALLEEQKRLRRRILTGEIPGPRLYLSGPALWQKSSATGNRLEVATVKEATVATKRLIELGVDNIFVSDISQVPLLDAIREAAHDGGLGVDAEARHMQAASALLEAGVDRIHVFFTTDALADYSDDELRSLIRGVRPTVTGPSANIVRGPWILCTLPMRQAYVAAKQFPESLDHARFREMFSATVYQELKRGWSQPQAIQWGIGAEERTKVVQRKLARFIEAGGREQLVAATDAGAPLNFHSPIPKQLRNLVKAGLTPMEAIQSATLRAAQMQGAADQLGTVSEGKFADLIVVDGDPLQEIEVLEHRIVTVIQNGRVVK